MRRRLSLQLAILAFVLLGLGRALPHEDRAGVLLGALVVAAGGALVAMGLRRGAIRRRTRGG